LKNIFNTPKIVFFMGRPKRISEPVKLNLLIDRESKIGAIALAAKRKMSVGRLFEALLLKERAEIRKNDCVESDNNTIECNTEVVEELPCLGNIIPIDPLSAEPQSESSKS
jgi:hypothetical protein